MNTDKIRVPPATSRRLERSVRRRLVDDVGQVLRHDLERLVDRQIEMAGEVLHLGVAENRLQLIRADWLVGAGTEP